MPTCPKIALSNLGESRIFDGNMPIYEYIADPPESGCRSCSKGFELRRPLDRPPLTKCPLCGAAVRKVIGKVSTPRVSKGPSISEAKSAGFTVLKRRDKGVYEKQ
jgi:putative FmdB family regulatory protein